MKIIIVGGSGTIGKKLADEFSKRHEVIIASRNSGNYTVDITSPLSIEQFYKNIGSFDALVSASGVGHYGALQQATDADFRKGVDSKLMGQINLVLIGQHYINANGSFTLTSGILAVDPIRNGSNLSTINGAINSFTVAAAVELEKGIRINTVSPGVVEDSPQLFPSFPGHIPVTMDRVVPAYVKSVEGPITGQIIEVF